jgi:hypothetical protein
MDGWRGRAWVASCIGEPASEIEDAFADEVPIAFGRHVLRLACAELGRTRDECRAESRPSGKREIIAGRRVQGIVPGPEPNHAIRAVIDEAIRAREAGESKVIPFNLCGHGHFAMQAYHAFLAGRLPEIEFEEAALADGLTSLPGIPVPG